MKRNNKKSLYESIMTSVAKQVKKALNEEYYDEDGVDVSGDCERWEEGIKSFLSENVDSEHTLRLFASLVGIDEMHPEEVYSLAARIMSYVEMYSGYDLPPVDEVFIDYIGRELRNSSIAKDFCADVIRQHEIDLSDMGL